MTTDGFSLIETIIVVAVFAVLTSMVSSGIGPARDALAIRQAGGTFVALHARARAHAIASGRVVRLTVDAVEDRVDLVENGIVIESIDFREMMAVDIQMSASNLTVCFNPRGIGDLKCNSFTLDTPVDFAHGNRTKRLTVKPLGGIER